DPDAIDQLRSRISDAAGRPIFMIDWRQRNATFFNALQVERNVMFLILMLIVLVAALNIVSGLIMLVKDKSSDIAVLRTMGATQGAVMRVFLITGASIGVVGTFTGFVVGTLVCLNVESIRQFLSWLTNTELFSPELYFLSRLPAEMDAGETFAVLVMALVLSLLATLYPSWRAARLDPVEALRYERPPRPTKIPGCFSRRLSAGIIKAGRCWETSRGRKSRACRGRRVALWVPTVAADRT